MEIKQRNSNLELARLIYVNLLFIGTETMHVKFIDSPETATSFFFDPVQRWYIWN